MNHSFDVDIACLHGVDAAILIENFRFWIAKNKANNRHFYDGRWWTYNSVKAFSELFPYWSGPQVRRIIEKMEDAGVLVSGSYNQNPWDKTKWYAFGDGFDLMKKSVPFAEIGKSDTDINTDINTDTTPLTPQGDEQRKRSSTPVCPDFVDQQVWEDWLALRKAKKAPVTATVVHRAETEAHKAGMPLEDFLRVWCRRGTQGLEAAWLKPNERNQGAGNGFKTARQQLIEGAAAAIFDGATHV